MCGLPPAVGEEEAAREVFPGGRGRHEVFRGAYTAGDSAPLVRRPVVFGCTRGAARPRNLRTRSELQARPGGRVGRCSSVQEEGESSGLPRGGEGSVRISSASSAGSVSGTGKEGAESKAGEPSYPADDGAGASSRGKKAIRTNPVMEDPLRTSELVPSLVQMVCRGHEATGYDCTLRASRAAARDVVLAVLFGLLLVWAVGAFLEYAYSHPQSSYSYSSSYSSSFTLSHRPGVSGVNLESAGPESLAAECYPRAEADGLLIVRAKACRVIWLIWLLSCPLLPPHNFSMPEYMKLVPTSPGTRYTPSNLGHNENVPRAKGESKDTDGRTGWRFGITLIPCD
ncbi:hypothetical protein B0H14DRAFT_2576737 [Mycena olivaceomarginata]|nr:hypothetical protein B0H14DRAFT_2576737 [Mycena olivaceomarginata]